MPIMQALIVGGGQEEDFIYETQYIPSPKELVTITPATAGITSEFTILGAPLLTVELWGGGGASGSARDGISGNGGAGGYVRAIVNVTDVPSVRIRVGGGGGTPDYYAIPSDEYATENIADIVSVGTTSANSQIALSTPFEVETSRTTTAATSGTNPAVSFVTNSSGSGVTSLIVGNTLNPISEGDLILVASSCDESSPPPNQPTPPTGFTNISNSTSGNPSYRLSYRYVLPTDIVAGQVTIAGLQASVTLRGVARPISHVAQVFRGVDLTATRGVRLQTVQTSTSNTIPLPNVSTTLTGCMLASFGFLDNVGLSALDITPLPTGHANLITASSNSVLPITPVTTLTIDGLAGDTFVATTDTDTSFTIGGLTAGDFVIVIAGSDGQNPEPAITPLGWTTIESGGNNPGRWVAYTIATETSITLTGLQGAGGGNTNAIAYAVLAFSGVDPEDLINGPVPTDYDFANGTTGTPNPPNGLDATVGCMSVVVGIIDDISRTPSAPGGYTLGSFASTPPSFNGDPPVESNAATVMSAYQLQTAAGTVNPGAFGLSDPAVDEPWTAGTIILRPRKVDSTVMGATRTLLNAGNFNNGSFTLPTSISEASFGVSVLLVRNNNIVPSSSTMTITGLSVGDIIVVASVNDNAIPSVPLGFSNIFGGAGYRLSWKRVTDPVADSTVSGLTTLGLDDDGDSALIRHVAYVYRNATDLEFLSPPGGSSLSTGTGNSISFSDILAAPDESLSQYACATFAFIKNLSLTGTGDITTTLPYTLSTIYPVGDNSTVNNSEATLANSFANGLPNNTPQTPQSLSISRNVSWTSISIALKPSASSPTFSGSISLPAGTQVGDLVLVASVSDNSSNPPATSLNTPLWAAGPTSYTSLFNENNNTPSYQLSYKFIESVAETTVDGLSTVTFTNNGSPRGTAHTVQVFRGVNPLLPILSSGPTTGSDNTIEPPPIGIASSRNAVVSFAFVDDRSVNVTAIPAGYTLGPVETVGTDTVSDEATVMSAYNLTPTFPTETLGNFTISNADDWDAVTIVLQNNVTQRFSSDPGACGGSSGGYTAIFNAITNDLILMVGGGGGGGGSSTIRPDPSGISPIAEANKSIGGSGGVGGGNGGSGLPGSNGNSFFASNGDFATAGVGGGGGSLISGGEGGNSFRIATIIPVLNPGETGIGYTNTTFGGRGANSPYNTADIPLQGANATGGYMAGRGGGSSRTSSTLVNAAIPSDCGGAGGAGYYGGGGGGPGLHGGGGGGGGGSAYYDPTIVSIISSEVGIGTNPAGRSSEFWTFPIGVGGASVSGNLLPVTPATTTVVGNGGGDGRAVITFFTFPTPA